MSKSKRPAVRIGDLVTVASHVSTPIRTAGSSVQVLKDTVLRVESITGKGTLRAPWQIVTKLEHVRLGAELDLRYRFDPSDLIPAV